MDVQALENDLNTMGLLVHKMRHWAESIPDKTFFYYGEEDRSLTYKEFNAMANTLARNLQHMGIEKGDRVSLFLQNPLVITLSMFALWKIGAVFCPINFLYKGRLLSYQLNDTQPKLLITERGREPILNRIKSDIGGLRVVLHDPRKDDHGFKGENGTELDRSFKHVLFADLLKGDDTDLDTEIHYWDTANIIYTSGTTGPPKGVIQSFRWLQNYCYYGVKLLHPDDVVYCDLPLYHIGGAFSLLGRAAWRGSTVAVWDRFSASDFWNRIKVSKASYSLLLDVMMPWLLQPEATPEDRYNTLRRAHMQPLPDYHYAFARRFGIDFVNVGYGSTETGYMCAALIDETVEGEGTPAELRKGYTKEEIIKVAEALAMPVVAGNESVKKGFMGRPCRLHEIAILGEHDEELGAGKYGQMASRSRLPYVLLNAYLNNPQATLDVTRNLWFHTGDGAYKDEDGLLYFVDRMGGFIRVRGENISSFQVEDVINAHPKVGVCAAFPVQAKEGLEDDIVVYVVPGPGQEVSEEELRSWTEVEMPKYMRPRYIRFIAALPETPTHKVEKYKLKELFLQELKETERN